MPIEHSWQNTHLLAKCLYKDKKFVKANWLLSDLILDCQNDIIKLLALELNGHCLMEMNKYAQAMKTFTKAFELASSCNVSNLRIHFAMYKYACDAQDLAYVTDLQYLILPWQSYSSLPLMEKEDIFETNSFKFGIEKSIQAMKPVKSEEAQNHLMFCNSFMITKMFEK